MTAAAGSIDLLAGITSVLSGTAPASAAGSAATVNSVASTCSGSRVGAGRSGPTVPAGDVTSPTVPAEPAVTGRNGCATGRRLTVPETLSGMKMNKPEPADFSPFELDDRPATFVCPQCAAQWKGKVFKSWWAIAEKRGDKNPWWKAMCTSCYADEVADKTRKQEAEKPKVSEALELDLPNIEGQPPYEDE